MIRKVALHVLVVLVRRYLPTIRTLVLVMAPMCGASAAADTATALADSPALDRDTGPVASTQGTIREWSMRSVRTAPGSCSSRMVRQI
jgi:hypothetical protein